MRNINVYTSNYSVAIIVENWKIFRSQPIKANPEI